MGSPGLDNQVVANIVVGLNAILDEDVVALAVVVYVFLHSEVVDSVDGGTSVP